MAQGDDPCIKFDAKTGRLYLEGDGHKQIICRVDDCGGLWIFWKHKKREIRLPLIGIIRALRDSA